MHLEFVWLAFCVLLSYVSLALSGFGGNIVTITLAAHLFPIKTLLPVVVPLTLTGNIYITARYHRDISRSVLFKNIIPIMGTGFVIGVLVFGYLYGDTMKKIFGSIVVLISLREIVKLIKDKKDAGPITRLRSFLYMFSAGIIQGIYASGGPLLVYAVSKLNLSKSVFRSTLSAVWLIFHATLTIYYGFTGKLTPDSLRSIIVLLPVLVAGTVIGEKLHNRINERHFQIVVFAILLFSGSAIVIR